MYLQHNFRIVMEINCDAFAARRMQIHARCHNIDVGQEDIRIGRGVCELGDLPRFAGTVITGANCVDVEASHY